MDKVFDFNGCSFCRKKEDCSNYENFQYFKSLEEEYPFLKIECREHDFLLVNKDKIQLAMEQIEMNYLL